MSCLESLASPVCVENGSSPSLTCWVTLASLGPAVFYSEASQEAPSPVCVGCGTRLSCIRTTCSVTPSAPHPLDLGDL